MARRLFHDLRVEGRGRGREALATGLGAFIGCLPFYGFHLLLVIGVGRLLGLNRLLMYLAANISNPLFAPALILLEVQTGAYLRRGSFHALTLDSIRATDPWTFGADLLIGAVCVGAVLGLGIAIATRAAVAHAPHLPPHLERVLDAAAYRYLEGSITAWEFARGKLRRDPVYIALLTALPAESGTLVDIGCGQGLALALLVEARQACARDDWPEAERPPHPSKLVGIETRFRVARFAAEALAGDADIVCDYAPAGLPNSFSTVLLLDVLHLMSHAQQEQLLAELRARIDASGVMLVRDVDAAGGAGFQAVRIGNRLKNLAVGRFRQTFAFRTAAEWRELFARQGWEVQSWPMGEGTPFANVLFKLTPTSQRSWSQSPT